MTVDLSEFFLALWQVVLMAPHATLRKNRLVVEAARRLRATISQLESFKH